MPTSSEDRTPISHLLCRAQFGYGAKAGDLERVGHNIADEALAAGQKIRQVVNDEAEGLSLGQEDRSIYGLGYQAGVGSQPRHQDKLNQHIRTRPPPCPVSNLNDRAGALLTSYSPLSLHLAASPSPATASRDA